MTIEQFEKEVRVCLENASCNAKTEQDYSAYVEKLTQYLVEQAKKLEKD